MLDIRTAMLECRTLYRLVRAVRGVAWDLFERECFEFPKNTSLSFPATCLQHDDDDCFYYHSWRHNGAITLATLSSFLTELHIVSGVVCVVCVNWPFFAGVLHVLCGFVYTCMPFASCILTFMYNRIKPTHAHRQYNMHICMHTHMPLCTNIHICIYTYI